jgi:hypothetical protein
MNLVLVLSGTSQVCKLLVIIYDQMGAMIITYMGLHMYEMTL